jgi:hypothetical protein
VELTAAAGELSEAVTVDAVARAVITHGRIVAGATAGEVMMLVEDGAQFETLYGESTDPQNPEPHRTPVEDGLCATDAVRNRRPVFRQNALWPCSDNACGGIERPTKNSARLCLRSGPWVK